ncbi:hypothetical protein SEMRO_550_G164640.1 [Seminavis robusta]|uniref:Uncharacterized protein n=1 Tax=Seminavis robusta TaxID=568900 RepID=A0A9N8E4S4_9STRA|nr:hypothetical protein SEMRO_550_G164640.1 [Seminavis robusta]|eukprot:Sro550_g164640.1 n/a (300) ;mRNA; f:12801-13804
MSMPTGAPQLANDALILALEEERNHQASRKETHGLPPQFVPSQLNHDHDNNTCVSSITDAMHDAELFVDRMYPTLQDVPEEEEQEEEDSIELPMKPSGPLIGAPTTENDALILALEAERNHQARREETHGLPPKVVPSQQNHDHDNDTCVSSITDAMHEAELFVDRMYPALQDVPEEEQEEESIKLPTKSSRPKKTTMSAAYDEKTLLTSGIKVVDGKKTDAVGAVKDPILVAPLESKDAVASGSNEMEDGSDNAQGVRHPHISQLIAGMQPLPQLIRHHGSADTAQPGAFHRDGECHR